MRWKFVPLLTIFTWVWVLFAEDKINIWTLCLAFDANCMVKICVNIIMDLKAEQLVYKFFRVKGPDRHFWSEICWRMPIKLHFYKSIYSKENLAIHQMKQDTEQLTLNLATHSSLVLVPTASAMFLHRLAPSLAGWLLRACSSS